MAIRPCSIGIGKQEVREEGRHAEYAYQGKNQPGQLFRVVRQSDRSTAVPREGAHLEGPGRQDV